MPATNQNVSRWIFFAFFFVSGFCSLVYQVIWTRLAVASFGIIIPIEQQTPEQLAARMPESAKKDLLEWTQDQTAPAYLEPVGTREILPEILLNTNVDVQITDDDPMNEYFLLRRTGLF